MGLGLGQQCLQHDELQVGRVRERGHVELGHPRPDRSGELLVRVRVRVRGRGRGRGRVRVRVRVRDSVRVRVTAYLG